VKRRSVLTRPATSPLISVSFIQVREAQIARLAADGLSNREIGEKPFISHRTVGYHLGRVFSKLDVANRAQLRNALDGARST
jgi:DNA-binding CsgD family transcriptional regulator